MEKITKIAGGGGGGRYLMYRETKIKKTAISPQKQCKQDDKGAIYKLLKETPINLEFNNFQIYNIFQNKEEILFKHTMLAEFITSRYSQQEMLQDVLQKTEMTPDGNVDLHKGMRNTGDGHCMDKYVIFLSYC